LTENFCGACVPARYIRSVEALPEHRLFIVMETGAVIHFDFSTSITGQFEPLRDQELFESVTTDGIDLIFRKPGTVPVRVSAQEILDLALWGMTRLRARI